ncbi:hypothetical protein C0J52_09218 [Blattella germanica]|nr:hypothetical protein C0J52_09218 [Blattella germanica]
MYNLNVNVSSSAASGSSSNLLSVENSCTTPKTPEILNSLIAMTNPFDGFVRNVPRIASCPPGGSDNSNSSGEGSSPTGNSPPSVQHTCSQLIKEGLKLTIQTKRRNTGRHLECLDSPRSNKMARRDEVSSHEFDYEDLFSPGVGESEILENQNQDLKSQIQELETQRRRLMDMLSMHTPTCMKNNSNIPYSPDSGAQTFCPETSTSGGYHHYSGSYTDNGCMA